MLKRLAAAIFATAALAAAVAAGASGPDMHFHGSPAAMHVHGHAPRVLASGMYHHS